METMNPDLVYEFYGKEEANRYKGFADIVVKDLRQKIGSDPEVQILIEPENPGSKKYSVAMRLSGLGETIFVKKTGRKVVPTLKKVKRVLYKRVKKLRQRRFAKKRNFRSSKELLAS